MMNGSFSDWQEHWEMDEPDDQPRKNPRAPTVQLSNPWGQPPQSANFHDLATPPKGFLRFFVNRRSAVHETYIIQQARNKRLGLVLAFLLILFAAGIVVFAPAGRQVMSFWVGGALLVFAAGAAGFGRVWANIGNSAVGADQGKGDIKDLRPPS
jgi:hypothetical protein